MKTTKFWYELNPGDLYYDLTLKLRLVISSPTLSPIHNKFYWLCLESNSGMIITDFCLTDDCVGDDHFVKSL